VRRTLHKLRRRIVFHWLSRDGGGFSAVAMFAIPVLALTSIVAFAFSNRSSSEPARSQASQARALELRCLAENIYFEARGEPLNGQYAVAEVTLNRVRSPHFPKTICAVVHDTRWDPLRRRFTAHFSWTQMEDRGEPWGPRWQQAVAVATAVIGDTYMPVVPGALYYHSTGVQPYWASSRRSVGKIGNHIFYR
jgi:spore germination cell wall hydrolase CwlJ-like protein